MRQHNVGHDHSCSLKASLQPSEKSEVLERDGKIPIPLNNPDCLNSLALQTDEVVFTDYFELSCISAQPSMPATKLHLTFNST